MKKSAKYGPIGCWKITFSLKYGSRLNLASNFFSAGVSTSNSSSTKNRHSDESSIKKKKSKKNNKNQKKYTCRVLTLYKSFLLRHNTLFGSIPTALRGSYINKAHIFAYLFLNQHNPTKSTQLNANQ